MYWSQARIVEEILAADDSNLAGLADAGQIATHLRARETLIVCGPDAVALEGPADDNTQPSRRVAGPASSAAEEMLGNGQFILPFPAGPTGKNGSAKRIPQPRRGKKYPLRDHPECE